MNKGNVNDIRVQWDGDDCVQVVEEGMTQIKLSWKVMDHLLATKGH